MGRFSNWFSGSAQKPASPTRDLSPAEQLGEWNGPGMQYGTSYKAPTRVKHRKVVQNASAATPKASFLEPSTKSRSAFRGKPLSSDSPWRHLRELVLDRDGYTCVLCGSDESLTVDHIVERQFGGTNYLNNLRTLCRKCHHARHGHNFLDAPFDHDDEYGFANSGIESAEMVALSNALDSKSSVGIGYTNVEGHYSERVVHPKRLHQHNDILYLRAHCELDEATRTFRVDRLKLAPSRKNFYTGNVRGSSSLKVYKARLDRNQD